MDGLTLLLAMLGGLFNGTFPIFIKTEKVLAAKVHPVIFQLYKSSWVMIVGVCCAIVRLIRGLPLAFTPWASLSAAAWIPSGVFTIIAVPLVGVGSSVLTFVLWPKVERAPGPGARPAPARARRPGPRRS